MKSAATACVTDEASLNATKTSRAVPAVKQPSMD